VYWVRAVAAPIHMAHSHLSIHNTVITLLQDVTDTSWIRRHQTAVQYDECVQTLRLQRIWIWVGCGFGPVGLGLQRIWVAMCITDQSNAWKDALCCCVQRVVLSGGYDKSGV
jgi:hypothetical protein